MAQIDAKVSQNGTEAERAATGSFSTYGGDPGSITEATDQTADGTETSPDDGIVFLADLARAMQATAAAEQARIAETTERRRQLHIGGIRAREAAEADEIREIADEDVSGINAWADGEIKRLKLERERRITARREQLQIRLEEHRAVIAHEVEVVEAAVATYRAELDRYFGGLESETDPVTIAQEAGKRPVFPALERIGPDDAPGGSGMTGAATVETAIAETAAESDVATNEAIDVGKVDQPDASGEASGAVNAASTADADAADADATLVAVMDPEAIGQPDAGVRWDASTDAPAEPGADDAIGVEGADQPAEEPAGAVAEATAIMPRSSGAGSWLRWPNNSSSDRFGPGR